jgi:membrane protease YdiL (CAAX protease family)
MPAFTGLNKKISLSVVLASVMLTLLAQPFIVQTAEWNSRLLLPDGLSAVENWMRRTEEQASMMTDAFLRTTSTRGLILNIFMIAILPAIAEELLFRGLIARMLHQATRNIHVAVILSAVLFAAIHIQFFSFLPRLLLGMLLGYLFFWSGSLWLPVTMHLTNNLLSVVVEFLYQTKMVGTTSGEFGRIENYYLLAGSLLCTGVLMAFIYRKRCLAPDAGRQ